MHQECKSYRGISLLSIVGRLYAEVLIERVVEETDDKIWDALAGMGCTDQIVFLRCIAEKFLAKAIVTVSQKVIAVDIKKLYYEKDMSEYCKRRVMPSIFLGYHVVEASAFILHFSKLDLPYNCFISVRTESGNNMIMVLNIKRETSLTSYYESCIQNNPQLVVYEMGETFGGYWGPLPEDMLKYEPTGTTYYTLKTTQATTMSTEPDTEESVETTTPTTTSDDSPGESQEFFQVEVPIVNVSGKFESGLEVSTKPFEFEEVFDYLYDVTPIPGVKYDTSILPLVQLSIRKQIDDGRRENGQEPRYDINILQGFTPDSRLTLPQFTPSHIQKYKTNVNRRMSFGRNRTTKSSFYKKLPTARVTKNNVTQYIFPTTIASERKPKVTQAPDSWEMIEKLMEKLNKNKEHDKSQDNNKKNTSKILENISNMEHNISIYLAPDLSVYNGVKLNNSLPITTKQTLAPFYPRSKVNPYRKYTITLPFRKKLQSTITTFPNSSIANKVKITEHKSKPVTSLFASNTITSTTEKSTKAGTYLKVNLQRNKKVSSDNITKGTIPPVSLVDHESWENIVQVAPDMAVLLNKVPHNAVNKSRDWSSLNETYKKELLERKKRAIHLISIENGRPHNLTTKTVASTTTTPILNVVDMQHFARLVELQDDDMHGRVALRYLKEYVGPSIYNICSEGHFYSKHMVLLNSSRIVLAFNNFSLSHMSVILTSARTLLSGEMQCPKGQLECQVSGARVCVDSLAACDGVPNCGSYDIYDEDRLMCGVTVGLQHNVYIAAFTFLALVFTLFYAVHYWLKRCVPKVAEAFFVYKNGIENIMYLETIMRSPGDYDDGPKIFYRGNMFADTEEGPTNNSEKNWCTRYLRKCITCITCFKKEENLDEDVIFSLGQKKTYSFTQMELNNMLGTLTVDTSVQTGESLEMSVFKEEKDYPFPLELKGLVCYKCEKNKASAKDPPIMINDSVITLEEPLSEDELSLLKFFRESRAGLSQSITTKPSHEKNNLELKAQPVREKELLSVMYDDEMKARPGPSGVKAQIRSSRQTGKRIRFNETTTTIPSLSGDEDNNDEEERPCGWHLGQMRTFKSAHLSTIKEDDESNVRHKHFWESKRKKTKKKTKVFLG